MRPRWQLPVRPPLPLRAVLSGMRAWLTRDAQALQRTAGRLRDRYGSRDVFLVNSGTAALTLAIRAAAAQRRGSAVALPAWCCYDVATAALGADSRVVLYDVDPSSLTPDLDSLRKALEQGAGSVVVATLYGFAPPWDQVLRLCTDAGALVIEDAAQAAGGRFQGRKLGTFGSLVVLSFGRGKGATGGRGGALLATDEPGAGALATIAARPGSARTGLAETLALLATWSLGRPLLYGLPASLPWLGLGETHFREPGAIGSMSRVCSGVLDVTLELEEGEIPTRRRNAEQLAALVTDSGLGAPAQALRGAEPGYLRLPVLCSRRLRAAATSREARRLGVVPAYPRVLGDLPRFSGLVVNGRAPFPGARSLAEALVTMPSHSLVDAGDLQDIARWLTRVSTTT